MRVRPGRVGRFHGDKGVHRTGTGIAKTEQGTPAYTFPLLTERPLKPLALPSRGYIPRLLRNIVPVLCLLPHTCIYLGHPAEIGLDLGIRCRRLRSTPANSLPRRDVSSLRM